MIERLKNNFSTKLLSVAIAVIIWVIVSNINDPVVRREISGIEVTFINEKVLNEINRTYELEGDDTISITVSGKRSIVSKLRAKDFEATADLSKLSIVDAVPIEVSLKNNNDQVTIDLGSNTMMNVKIDEMKTATIPVNIETEGEPADGYAVGKKTASPNMIEVTGPETIVDKIESVVLSCDVSGKSEDIESKVETVFYSKSGKKVSSSKLKYDEEEIDIKVELWKEKEISVEVYTSGTVAEGYEQGSIEYEPKKVTVVGPDDELEEVDNIELGAVDIDGATSDVEENISLTTDLLPGNVTFSEDNSEVAVKVKVGKTTKKTLSFSASDVQVLGQEEGQTISFAENQYEMTISGFESDLEDIKIEDLEPHIQVSELTSGTHRVQIRIADNKNIELVSIDTATIRILKNTTTDSTSITQSTTAAE